MKPDQCERQVIRHRAGSSTIKRQCVGANGFGSGGSLCCNHAMHDDVLALRRQQQECRGTQTREKLPNHFQSMDADQLRGQIAKMKELVVPASARRRVANFGIAAMKRRLAHEVATDRLIRRVIQRSEQAA